jgi:hypothetical protein
MKCWYMLQHDKLIKHYAKQKKPVIKTTYCMISLNEISRIGKYMVIESISRFLGLAEWVQRDR